MNIKEIIDAERISLEKVKARYGPIAYEVTGMLNRIEEKASNLLYPSVRKIWIDNEGSIRIDFLGNWRIAVQEGVLYDLIEDAKAPLLKRIAELELRLGCCRDASAGKDLLIAELEAQLPKVVRPEKETDYPLSYWCDCDGEVFSGDVACRQCGAKLDWRTS